MSISASTRTSLPLRQLVTSLDEGLVDSPGVVLVKVTAEPAEPDGGNIAVGMRPLPDGDHPVETLLGFTAPSSWTALGLHCSGQAYRFDPGSSYTFGRSEAGEATAVRFTMLLGRDGQGAGIMRDGSGVTPLPFPPEGMLGDTLRRALGLPTAPPPLSTVELWLRVWLDRLIDAVAVLGSDAYRHWDSVVSIHPVATASAHCPVGGPVALADATCCLAEAWPWDRLRHEPDIVEVPQPPLSPEVTEWMDDGMYARWTLASLPSLDELAGAVVNILPAGVAGQVTQTVTAAGLLWPQLTR